MRPARRRITVPGTLAGLSDVTDFVLAAAELAALSRRASYGLRLAVDEVATNIVTHGYAQNDLGQLDLVAEIDDECLRIILEDTSPPWDPAASSGGFDDLGPLEEREEGGLGLMIANYCVDNFSFARHGGVNRNTFVVQRRADTETPGWRSISRARSVAATISARAEQLRGLADIGVQVDVVGVDAWKAAMIQGNAELGFLDVHLPGIDPVAVLRELEGHPTARGIPVLLLTRTGGDLQIAPAMEAGAWDIVPADCSATLVRHRVHNAIQHHRTAREDALLRERQQELERLAHDFTRVIIPIGFALSHERSFDRLMERIVVEAMSVCHADAGTLYLRDGDALRFSIMRTHSMNVALGGSTGAPVPFEPLRLRNAETGEPNLRNAATYAALHERSVRVADIYEAEGFDFPGAKEFDARTGYRTRSCLTVPLAVGGGEVAGVLQLLNAQRGSDSAVTPFSAYDQEVVELLGSQAAIVLHNHRLLRDRAELIRVEGELETARQIEQNFLPGALPEPPGWHIAAAFEPAGNVSGDFYDAFLLSDGHALGVVIADVCDKGSGAALFMGLIRSLLRAFAERGWTPSLDDTIGVAGLEDETGEMLLEDAAGVLRTAIQLTNDYLATNHGALDMFATVFFGVAIPSTGVLQYVNCGHLPPVIVGPDGVRRELARTGPAIGVFPRVTYTVGRDMLLPGETLFGYTDGVTDARDPEGDRFTAGRLAALLQLDGDAETLVARVREGLAAHVGEAEQFDDITMIAVHRDAEAGRAA